jgi:divalent metal cation (Fe/Co/Zn/Cd) transporter
MLRAALVGLGISVADPVIAIVITGVILRITGQSGEIMLHGRHHS